MAGRPDEDPGLLGGVRRAVGGAFDATVGKVGQSVGEAAIEVTGATAEQVINELEPYLIEEAVPRIVAGITPYLIDQVVPEILDGVSAGLVSDTVPELVDGVTGHLAEVTVPQILEEAMPRLVGDLLPALLEDLRPFLTNELVPHLVTGLLPYLRQDVAPEVVDALMPKIRAEVAPDLVDSLLPMIEQDVAPRLVDALMPKIRNEVAPDLVDALMPKIRAEVVPTILDDIIDDPKLRELIREQSQGLFLDALESLRENLADADDMAERVGRRILRKPPREMPPTALALVLPASGQDAVPAHALHVTLVERGKQWATQPKAPAPPGREYAYAGVITRVVSLVIDTSLVGWLVSQGLTALIALLTSTFGTLPPWLTLVLTGIAVWIVPTYMGLSWRLTGRTLGNWLVGTRVCTPDGRKPGLIRALARAYVIIGGIVIWVLTGVLSLFDSRRRALIDDLLRTEVRYVVPPDQQHRYVREALAELRRSAAAAAPAGQGGTAPGPPGSSTQPPGTEPPGAADSPGTEPPGARPSG